MTVGYITIDGHEYFKTTEEDIRLLITNGVGETLKSHVWLTLPSMEIIDFTFVNTYLIKTGAFDGFARVLANHPDQLSGDLSYHPMVVGAKYLHKIRAINAPYSAP